MTGFDAAQMAWAWLTIRDMAEQKLMNHSRGPRPERAGSARIAGDRPGGTSWAWVAGL